MAPLIAIAIGRGAGYETKGTRLADKEAEAQANSRKTFTTAMVHEDGSGHVAVERIVAGKRQRIGEIVFGREGANGEKDDNTVDVFFESGHFAKLPAYPRAGLRNSRSEPVEVAVARADALGEEGRDR